MFYYLIFFLLYVVAELIGIVRYLLTYIRLNSKFNGGDKIKGLYVKEFLKDMKELDYDLLDFEGLFYNKIKSKDMRKDKVIQCLSEMVNNGKYDPKVIKRIESHVSHVENKHSVNFRNVNLHVSNKRIKWNRMPIKSWYTPLALQFAKSCVRAYVDYKLEHYGYELTELRKGYTIWTNGFDKSKGKPIVFFHCSVGGLIFYNHILKNFGSQYNLILPEVPGMSWRNYTDDPPQMSEMVDMVVDFIDNNKKYANNKVDTFSVAGHSFGCNVAASMVNRHEDRVENLMIIEGSVFFPGTIKNYHEFDRDIWDYAEIPINDLITVPLFYRDLYTQYYFMRSFVVLENMLFGLTSLENDSNRKIHFVYSGSDRKIDHESQLKYINMKNIQCSYSIFEGRTHGAFNFDTKMQSHVSKILDKWTTNPSQ